MRPSQGGTLVERLQRLRGAYMGGSGVAETVEHARDPMESARERCGNGGLLPNGPQLMLLDPTDSCADMAPPLAPRLGIQDPVFVEFDKMLQLIQCQTA